MMNGSSKKTEVRFCGAVDVGGTKLSAALFTADGRMSHKVKIPINRSAPDKPVHQIRDIVEEMEKKALAENGAISAVGIAVPGVVFHGDGLVWAPNIPGWDHLPLGRMLKHLLRPPVVLDSDRAAYVSGEQWRGAAQDKKDVVFLAVGTGIGAGILVDGRLCRGCQDIAGAVGWFVLDTQYREEYARMGCFEAEASGDSVARRAIRLIEEGESSVLQDMTGGDVTKITAETVVEAYRKGDRLAQDVLAITARYLAMGIANIISILNPEIVVLGGGLFQSGDLLLELIKEDYKKWAQPLAAQRVRLALSTLGEDAGLFGAGKLAWDQC